MSVIYIRNKDGALVPISSNNTIKTVNGVGPDESGNIEITIPDSGGNVELDTTLTQSGKAADAKAVGDALANVGNPTDEQVSSAVNDYLTAHPVSGVSSTEKTLFLSLFKNSIFATDMTSTIAQLEAYWNGSGGSGDSGGNEGGGDTGGDSGDEPGGDIPPVAETLPSWIAEMQVVEFTPEADTNTAQTFAISMENEPNMVFVNSDIETPEAARDLAALTYIKLPSGVISRIQYAASTKTAIIGANTTDDSANCSITASEVVLATSAIGTENAYWRAGHTYKIYCVKTVFDTADMAHTPGFAKEVYPVVFSPEADTTEAQTFAYEMENEPNAILIISDITEVIGYRNFVGAFGSIRYNDVNSSGSGGSWRGIRIIDATTKFSVNAFTSSNGVTALGNGSMTFYPGNQAGADCKWKAGYNYLILFMVL